MEIRDVMKEVERDATSNAYQKWLRKQCGKNGHNYMLCVGAGNTVYYKCIDCNSRAVTKKISLEPVC